MPPALDRKTERSVQPGNLVHPQAFGLPFPESHPGHPGAILHLVIERNRIAAQMQPSGQSLQPFAGVGINQLGGVEHDPGPQKVLPARHRVELLPYPDPQLVR